MIDPQLNFRMGAVQHTTDACGILFRRENAQKLKNKWERACITKHVYSCEHVCVSGWGLDKVAVTLGFI